MVARTGAIFELAPVAAGDGGRASVSATALYAATIAVAQHDIKRVLAYSTISQLGYMFAGVGAAAYVAGIFHLMTHAFFKALLFLGAGVGDPRHGRRAGHAAKMGGLWRKMPVTVVTMVIAWLAISGIPPLSGLLVQGRDPGHRLRRGAGPGRCSGRSGCSPPCSPPST